MCPWGGPEVSIWISRLIHRPSSVWVAPIKPIESFKRTGRWKKREFPPLPVFKLGHWFSPALSLCVCVQWFSHVWLVTSLSDPCSPPGSSVRGIFQVRILEWVALSFSRRSSWPRDWTCIPFVSCTGNQILCHQRHLGSPHSARNLDHYQLSWFRALGSDQTSTTGFS